MTPPDTIGPNEIRDELASRLPDRSSEEIDRLTAVFVQMAGGKYVSGKRLSKAQRNTAICTSYDGANLEDLARRYQLSTRHVRRLIHGK
jgi:Mor family transcriptional regulator